MTQSHETNTPEQNPSTAEIALAFDQALSDVDKLRIMPGFEIALETSGVDLDAPAGEAYWNVFNRACGTVVEQMRAGDKVSSLRADTLELVAATPTFLHEQRHKRAEVFANTGQRQKTREYISHYNGLIRDYARNYPDVSVAGLQSKLAEMGTIANKAEGRKEDVAEQLSQTVRGAQHELGFGQLLEAAGFEVHDPGVEDDMAGIDYIVGDAQSGLRIDVKASLFSINNKSVGYDVRGPGHAVMYSMLKDEQFGDRMFIPDHVAESLTAPVAQQILQAQRAA